MGVNVNPNITIISDCSHCCPRRFRWLCCCMSPEDYIERCEREDKIRQAAEVAIKKSASASEINEMTDPDPVIKKKRVRKKKATPQDDELREVIKK